MASLPPSELAFQEAHLNDGSRTITIIVVGTLFTTLALLSLVTRLLARRLASATLGWDDYFALAAMVPLIGLNVAACLIGHWGIGRVLLWVALDPKNFIRIGKTELAFSVFYDWSMALSKLSVLALLSRVFTLHRTWFKIGIYFWATWTILWWTAGWFIIFLECRPLSTNWGDPHQCRPAFRSSVSAAVVNAVSDVGILALPQPLIWQLQLPSPRKISLSFLFLVGCFATAVSIARIPLLKGVDSDNNYDSTYSSFYGVLFTVLEPCSVHICACLPMAPGVFKRLPTTRLSSKLFYSFSRSSRQRHTSADEYSHPVVNGHVKQEQWTKLGDNAPTEQVSGERQHGHQLYRGNEEFELRSATGRFVKEYASTDGQSVA